MSRNCLDAQQSGKPYCWVVFRLAEPQPFKDYCTSHLEDIMIRKDMHYGVVMQCKIYICSEYCPFCMRNKNSSSSDCMKQYYTNFKLRNHVERHFILGQVSCSHSICTAEFPCSANIPYVIFSYSSKSPCIAYKNAGEREKTLKHQIIVSIDDAAFVEHGTVEQAEDCKVL